jgi:hypothetical protein
MSRGLRLAMEGETIVSGSAAAKRQAGDGRHHPFANAAGVGRGERGPRYLLARRRSRDRGANGRS